jgi:hypothetical protein
MNKNSTHDTQLYALLYFSHCMMCIKMFSEPSTNKSLQTHKGIKKHAPAKKIALGPQIYARNNKLICPAPANTKWRKQKKIANKSAGALCVLFPTFQFSFLRRLAMVRAAKKQNF